MRCSSALDPVNELDAAKAVALKNVEDKHTQCFVLEHDIDFELPD
jgi:hypothetical protein